MNHLFHPVTNYRDRQRVFGMSVGIILLFSLLFIATTQRYFTKDALAETNAATYYVATNGADGNPGTQSQPLATIQKALKLAKAGDTIQVRGGTYHEAVRIANSGTADQPITVMAYPGEKPILDGQYTLPEGKIARCNNSGSASICFTFNALVRIIGSHIRFSGFELTRSYGRGIDIGNSISAPTSDVIIDHCNVHDVRNNPIQVRFAEDVLVQNCVAYHGSDYATNDRPTSELNWPSMLIAIDAERVIFRGNTVYDNWGEGVSAGAGSSDITFEDNVIYDNMGLQIYVHRTRNVIIRRNLMYHTGDSHFLRGGNPSGCVGINNEQDFADSHHVKGVEIYDNIFVGCQKNIALWNSDGSNTLIEDIAIHNNTLVNAAATTARSAVNISIACNANVKNIVIEKNIFLQRNPVVINNPCLTNQAVGVIGQNLDEASAREQFIGQAPISNQIRYISNLWWPAVPSGMEGSNDLVVDPQLANPDATLTPGAVSVMWYRPKPSSPAIPGDHGAQSIFNGNTTTPATPVAPNRPTATPTPTKTPTPTTPRPTPVGCLSTTDSVVANPGFETGKAPWLFHTNGVGNYAIAAPGFECKSAAQLQIKKQGGNVQLYQKQIRMEPNTRYRLSFYAYSNSGNDLKVYLEKNGGNRANYGVKAMRADLTTKWRLFTTEFTSTNLNRSAQNGRLRFWLAPYNEAGDEYLVDHVVLDQISNGRSSAPAAPEVEMVELVEDPDAAVSGGTVSGYIKVTKANGSQAPLEEFEVTLIDEETGGFDFEAVVETDEDGFYFIEGVPAGDHTLTIIPPLGYIAGTASSVHVEAQEAIERTYIFEQAVGILYLPLVMGE